MTEPVFIGNRMYVDGFIYKRSKPGPRGAVYWECLRLRKKECNARATTVASASGTIVLTRGPEQETHKHPPDQEEVQAEITTERFFILFPYFNRFHTVVKTLLFATLYRVKQLAKDNPNRPPSAILREVLPNVSTAVLAQMPDRENLKKSMRRAKKDNLDPNPTTIEALGELPEKYQKTLLGENFLLYDSGAGTDDRVLVFSTRRNLELLSRSRVWFLDGTFKVCSI